MKSVIYFQPIFALYKMRVVSYFVYGYSNAPKTFVEKPVFPSFTCCFAPL